MPLGHGLRGLAGMGSRCGDGSEFQTPAAEISTLSTFETPHLTGCISGPVFFFWFPVALAILTIPIRDDTYGASVRVRLAPNIKRS